MSRTVKTEYSRPNPWNVIRKTELRQSRRYMKRELAREALCDHVQGEYEAIPVTMPTTFRRGTYLG